MNSLVLTFLLLYGIERLLETFWHRPKLVGKIIAPYSLGLIVAGYVTLYLVVLVESINLNEREAPLWTVLLGIALVVVSVIGRSWSIRTLGVYHSIHIEIRDTHRLVREGPYQYVRNPYYLSNIIESIGLPLVANSMLAMATSVFLYLPFLIHRIVTEERSLKRKFGPIFAAYEHEVPRIVPTFFGNKKMISEQQFGSSGSVDGRETRTHEL